MSSCIKALSLLNDLLNIINNVSAPQKIPNKLLFSIVLSVNTSELEGSLIAITVSPEADYPLIAME
jgi:hypothetical protein